MTPLSTSAPRGTIITITSGKGGVGKTSVVINLALSLARLGHRVGILDADFGLGNVDVQLGLTPQHHLGDYLTGEKSLEEITIRGPLGVRIIPSGSGIRSLTALDRAQWAQLSSVIHAISGDLDYLLLDTAAGISDNVVEPLAMAERILVVTSFEPAAVVDAYALIKIATGTQPNREIGLVVNGARDADEAAAVFRQLDVAASRFLHRSLRYYGFVLSDPSVREASLGQRAVVDHAPHGPASRCFRILASRLAGLTPLGGQQKPMRPVPSPDAGGRESARCA
jgi:flagellar biosynthesis protein FlhG